MGELVSRMEDASGNLNVPRESESCLKTIGASWDNRTVWMKNR